MNMKLSRVDGAPSHLSAELTLCGVLKLTLQTIDSHHPPSVLWLGLSLIFVQNQSAGEGRRGPSIAGIS